MFVKELNSGDLIKVDSMEDLMNPSLKAISGRIQSGQEEQDPAQFKKTDVTFVSGEKLPKCWTEQNIDEVPSATN